MHTLPGRLQSDERALGSQKKKCLEANLGVRVLQQ